MMTSKHSSITWLAKTYIIALAATAALFACMGLYMYLPSGAVDKLPRVRWLDSLRPTRGGLLLGASVQLPKSQTSDPLAWATDPGAAAPVGDCVDGLLDKSVRIPREQLDGFYKSGVARLALADGPVCLRQGQGVFVVTSETSGGETRFMLRALARITKIQRVRNRSVEVALKQSQTLALGELSTAFAAPWHPDAKVVGRKDLTWLRGQTAVFVDARSGLDFAEGSSIEGALNIPGPSVAVGEQDPGAEMIALRLKSAVQTSQALVVYDSGPLSYAAFRLLSIARKAGYRKLYWFWEGTDYVTGNSALVPESVGSVQSWERTDNAAADQFTLIDVRTDEEQTAEPALVGALSRPYRITWHSSQVRRPDLKAEWLKAMGDKLDPKGLPKDKPLLVFGLDRADWRAAKAALLLKSIGYTDVRYALNGVADLSAR